MAATTADKKMLLNGSVSCVQFIMKKLAVNSCNSTPFGLLSSSHLFQVLARSYPYLTPSGKRSHVPLSNILFHQ